MCILQNDQKLKTEGQENHSPQSEASSIYTNSGESFYDHICLMTVFHELHIHKRLTLKISQRTLLHYNVEKITSVN